ncbi:MAG TPA: DUF1269 domain-containing protein [Puia sp.]|nr:DUF1269 domain-containing protein [Puia sp.]
MTNLIVASFSQEAQATEASNKLTELESLGDITIYEMVVVKKNADGEAHVLQADSTEGLTTVSGMAIGSLVGAFAGPVGLALGMVTGTLAGAAIETDDYGFAEDFVTKITDQLAPGTVAVIAEVEEDDPVFIDSSLNPLGATLTRTDVDYEYTKYSDEEIEEFDEDIAAARAKLKSAGTAEKEKMMQKIAKLKEKRRDRIAEFKEKVKEAAADIKISGRERKIAQIRSKIEKHQLKIADLEKKLQAVLEKGKEEPKETAAHS